MQAFGPASARLDECPVEVLKGSSVKDIDTPCASEPGPSSVLTTQLVDEAIEFDEVPGVNELDIGSPRSPDAHLGPAAVRGPRGTRGGQRRAPAPWPRSGRPVLDSRVHRGEHELGLPP